MLPRLEEIRTTFEGVERRGNTAWKVAIGKRVLVSKWEVTEERGVESVGTKEEPRPALRIKVLIVVMLWVTRVAGRESEEESVKGTMSTLLPGAVGRVRRSSVGVVDERIVAMTVVLGRRRREAVRPSPIPVYK